MDEQTILNDLISNWVSPGLQYVGDAPGVTAVYVYVSSEPGSVYPSIFFEQHGKVLYPSHVEGTDTSHDRVFRMLDLELQDLYEAQQRFDEIGVPRPTEYRVYYEIPTGKLDVQLSREIIYDDHPTKAQEDGIIYWLGDRAPRLY